MLGLRCCYHWNLSQRDLSPGLFQVPWEVFLLPLLKVKVKLLSRVWLFAIPWTVVYQASLSMGFSRQEYWSGLAFPSPGDLPDPGIEPRSPALQADALPSEPPPYNPFSTLQPWWTFKKSKPDHVTLLLNHWCLAKALKVQTPSYGLHGLTWFEPCLPLWLHPLSLSPFLNTICPH